MTTPRPRDVAARVIERGAEQTVPSIIEQTGLPEHEAYLLFAHKS